MNEHLCRYVAEQGKLKGGCRNQAEYEIWSGVRNWSGDHTESCSDHLEKMLDKHNYFEVYRILGTKPIEKIKIEDTETAVVDIQKIGD